MKVALELGRDTFSAQPLSNILCEIRLSGESRGVGHSAGIFFASSPKTDLEKLLDGTVLFE